PAIAVAQTCLPPPPGIIAWWPFDEMSGTTAQDIAGNHLGAYVGSPTPTQGKVSGGLHFDGTGAFGSGPYIGVLDYDAWAFGNADFSIEFWVNFGTAGGGEVGHPSHIFVGNDEGAGFLRKWFFAFGGGVLNFHVNGPGSAARFLPQVPFSPVVGQWYHL